MPKERWDDEWREVQDHRYNNGFYPGSGKINPFFTKLAKPSRRFGMQLVAIAVVCAVLPFVGLLDRSSAPGFLVLSLVFAIGGVSHIRMAARSTGTPGR